MATMTTKRRLDRVPKWLLPVVALLLIGGGAFVLWAATLPVPDFNTVFEQIKNQASTKIYDRTGEVLLYDLSSNIRRTNVPFDRLSTDLKNATVAIEDDRFYSHGGIEVTSIIRAIWVDLWSGSFSQGGSTITQQVVKNAFLSQEKTITRKVKEWILALKLERVMSKDDILNAYLNETPYGSNIYGAEAAANAYFGTTAEKLTLAQAAYLAALPKAPSYYSPYGSHRDLLDARKDLVLKRMHDLGFITDQQRKQAEAEKVIFIPGGNQSIKAPHFVFYLKSYLAEKYGEDFDQQGLKVTTTLDWNFQQEMEAVIKRYAADNEKNFRAGNTGMVAVDPTTGQIVAMVGSRDYFDATREGNFNVTTAKRQPGSAFKPIVYATAFSKGYTDKTVVFDLPMQFSTACANGGSCYSPQNYTGNFVGPISFRSALAQSRNVPSVEVLYLAGINDSIKMAQAMGITTLTDPKRYGLSLVLGGGEVTLLEMTGAYASFANEGKHYPNTPILKVENGKGEILEEFKPDDYQSVITPEVARTISSILSDNEARAPVFGPNSSLNFPGYEVAVKTGTTQDYRDAWVIGYTPSLVIGAWAGNNDNTPMSKNVAGVVVTPMWHALMLDYLQTHPAEHFAPSPEPDPNLKPVLRGFWRGNDNYFVDKISGQLATNYTPPETREERVLNNVHSILYWVDRNNPTGPPPTNPANDPQFGLWEGPVRAWAAQNGLAYVETRGSLPTGYDSVHQPGSGPQVSITNPSPNQVFNPGDNVTVSAIVNSSYPVTKVDFFLNDNYLGSATNQPWQLVFSPSDIDQANLKSDNELKAVASDSIQNKGVAAINIKINFPTP